MRRPLEPGRWPAHDFKSERATSGPMVTLDWRLERSGGVTLVGLVVEADRSCRVRVENSLDGPVWPPRRHGEPVAGWEDGTFTGRVPDDGTLTVGYATPAPIEEPPATVAAVEPAADADSAVESGNQTLAPTVKSTPSGVVRALGDPVVPRDSVPVPEPRTASDRASAASAGDGGTDDPAAQSRHSDERSPERGRAPSGADEEERSRTDNPVVPGAVRAWLRDVEERLDADREGRPNGSDANRRGTADERRRQAVLASAREADRSALRQVRERVDALLARTEGYGERGTRDSVSAGTTARVDDGER